MAVSPRHAYASGCVSFSFGESCTPVDQNVALNLQIINVFFCFVLGPSPNRNSNEQFQNLLFLTAVLLAIILFGTDLPTYIHTSDTMLVSGSDSILFSSCVPL